MPSKKAGYSRKDWRDVSNNPELTRTDFASAKPFAEAFPDLAASVRKEPGPNQKMRGKSRMRAQVTRPKQKGQSV
jgi:hypothetical protein